MNSRKIYIYPPGIAAIDCWKTIIKKNLKIWYYTRAVWGYLTKIFLC